MEQQRSGIPSFEARGEVSFELVHATEAAALACAGFLGKGDAEGVSNAAGEAMRRGLGRSDIAGTVVLSPRHNAAVPPGAGIGAGDPKVGLGGYPAGGASPGARGPINPGRLLGAL